MTAQELTEIRERLRGTTPGPWECDRLGNVNGPDTGYGELRVATLQSCARVENETNGKFIAHARADIPRLLDEVERLRTKNAKYLAELDLLRPKVDDLQAENVEYEKSNARFRGALEALAGDAPIMRDGYAMMKPRWLKDFASLILSESTIQSE